MQRLQDWRRQAGRKPVSWQHLWQSLEAAAPSCGRSRRAEDPLDRR